MAHTIKVGNNALLGINVDRKRWCANIFTFPCFNRIRVSMVVTGNIIPYTDRKACNYYSSSLREIVTIASKLNSEYVFSLIVCRYKVVFTVKPMKSLNIIKFPVIHTVKVKSHLNRLNSFDCINLYINPVYSIVQDIVKRTVLWLNANGIFAFSSINGNLTLDFGIVTHLITDTHTDSMNTIGQNCV